MLITTQKYFISSTLVNVYRTIMTLHIFGVGGGEGVVGKGRERGEVMDDSSYN